MSDETETKNEENVGYDNLRILENTKFYTDLKL